LKKKNRNYTREFELEADCMSEENDLMIRVPPGVQIQNTRVQPDDVGLFLSGLRFESQVHKSQVGELPGSSTPQSKTHDI
jgi:hypothetical protein